MNDLNPQSKEQELIDKIEKLELELEKINTESKDNWESFIRCKAEIENIKKRTDKEINNISNFCLQNILTDLITVLDTFELCLKNQDNNSIKTEGVLLINKMLTNILEKYNLKKINILDNEKFDILKHEVIEIINDNEKEDDIVDSVLQNGYTLNNRIIRYAKVRIIKNNFLKEN